MDELSELTAGAPTSFRETLRRGRVSVSAVRELCEVKDARGVIDLSTTLLTVLAVPVLAWLLPHPVTYMACFLLAIHNFNCLAQLVHESDHGSLFRASRLNTLVGNLCAYPVGYHRYGHREAHLDHHTYLNTERDPDRIWNRPDQTTRDLFGAFLRDLFLASAIHRFLQYALPRERGGAVSTRRPLTAFGAAAVTLLPVFVMQALIFGLFAFTAGPWFYLWLHVLPAMTLYPAQIRLRSTVEHSFAEDWPPSPDGVWVSRTTRPNLLEWFLFAPFGQYYHYEHHIFPAVPHYNLGRVHRLLLEAGIRVPVTTSYVGFLVRKIRAERRGVWTTP